MKNSKRILSVTVFRICDTDPDTSYLGEYGNTAKTEYAIDRAHDLGCASQSASPQTAEAKRILEHVQQTVGDLHNAVLARYNGTLANAKLDAERDALSDAYDEVGELLDAVAECDCSFSGHWNNREYRFFNGPVENYKGEPDADIRKYVLQDYARMESLNAGNWCYISIRAEAVITVSIQTKQTKTYVNYSETVQKITSGGLWGIESDSDKSYLESVEQDELADLRTQLKARGFSTRAISAAFKNVEEKEE